MSRIHAVIIGIDTYKYGGVWNLESCTDDAKAIRRWLTHNLDVPRDQIYTLFEAEATQSAIQESLSTHLLHNCAIRPGDAMFIYFAGHGSNLPAPREWGTTNVPDVQLLCAYDHDTKGPSGQRVTGISDRSFTSFLRALSRAKGNNITVMIDAAFTPEQTRANIRERRFTRWTPTTKVTPEDLIHGLWPSASRKDSFEPDKLASTAGGFYAPSDSYTMIVGASAGERATENKEGGKFTSAFLQVKRGLALYEITVSQLISHVSEAMDENQNPVVVGNHQNSMLFLGLPFGADPRFVRVNQLDPKKFRIEIGSTEGVQKGTELTLHAHHYHGSRNPPLGSVHVSEVHTTWSIVTLQSGGVGGWAQVSAWNPTSSLRVYFRDVVKSLMLHHRKSSMWFGSKPSSDDVVSLSVRRYATDASGSGRSSDGGGDDVRKGDPPSRICVAEVVV